MRIFLVDDSAAFLDAAAGFFSGCPEVEVIGRALSGHEALEQVVQLRPDVVLLDLAMPDMNGLETARRVRALSDAPRIVMLTLYDDPAYRAAAMAAGADGFVSKAALSTQLLPLLQTLLPRRE